MRTLVWFRGKDLRLADHEPLRRAAGDELIPLFVLDPYFFAPARARELSNRLRFLLASLTELAAAIATRGSQLVVLAGRSVDLVPAVVDALRVDRVVAQRWVEPFGRERDRRIAAAIGDRLELVEGETLWPPGSLRSAAGRPFVVFSQFARAFEREARIRSPSTSPHRLPPLPRDLDRTLAAAGLARATIPSPAELGMSSAAALQPGGEVAARGRLRAFLGQAAASYADDRDRLDRASTSRLSADLKFGTLSVREVWHAVGDALGDTRSATSFRRELLWREFSHSTLWDRPELLERPFRADFVGFPWRADDDGWRAWTAGQTGYPVVDAAARQLLAEGFVPNRARMIAASFLTKHLMIDYRRGEAHYLRHLTDGDWAQNNLGWQWSAGCGCDAQPYFRIFNPIVQGERFDPDGTYVRRWLPELRELPTRFIHRPWLASAGSRGVGDLAYPPPIVDHGLARERYLALARAHLAGARRAAPGPRARAHQPSTARRRRPKVG